MKTISKVRGGPQFACYNGNESEHLGQLIIPIESEGMDGPIGNLFCGGRA